jgi:hypothetical protein
MDLFEMVERKKKDGSTVDYIPAEAMPRGASSETTYLAREAVEVQQLGQLVAGNDLFGSGESDDKTGLADKAI